MEPPVDPAAVRRQSYWLESQGAQLLSHAHIPASSPLRPTAVLVCNPLGHEAIHAHRSLAYLADALAANGFLAVRFDYRGTGNSVDDARTEGLFDSWQANVQDQVRGLRDHWGIADVCLLGFRFGANIAALNAADSGVRGLVLWEPVPRGRSYVRELRAAALSAGAASADASLDSGGFVFSGETIGRIRDADLGAATLPEDVPTLVVCRPSVRAKLPPDVSERRNCRLVESDEYLDMVAEPHFTRLPGRAIGQVLDWLRRDLNSALPATARLPGPETCCAVGTRDGQRQVTETILRSPGAGLFGILTEPAGGSPGGYPVVILSNAGSVCNVGPNRLYVELARRLAARGYSSVRVDLRNLGESAVGAVEEANLPYPGTAVDDIRELLGYLSASRNFDRFILSGLCSGAFTSFRAALAVTGPRIEEIVMINPLTFHWVAGMTMINPAQHNLIRQAHYYDHVIRLRKNWKNLLTGKTQYRRLFGFLVHYLLNALTKTIGRILKSLRLIDESQLTRDLMQLKRNGVFVTFLFSRTDPGHRILMADASGHVRRAVRQKSIAIKFVADADHTFSREHARRRLIEAFVDGIESRYPDRRQYPADDLLLRVPVGNES